MGFNADGLFIIQDEFKSWDLQINDGSILIEGKVNNFTLKKELAIKTIIDSGEYFIYLIYNENDGWNIEAEQDWPFESKANFIKSKQIDEEEYGLDFIVFPLYHFYKETDKYKEINELLSNDIYYTKLVGDTDLTQIQSIFSVKREETGEYDLVLAPKLVSAFNFNYPL